MIPVFVLTGFLGSGKTTLLARLVKSPEFSRTAVVINEFGEAGIDHDLIETSEESFTTLETGCLCCTSRSDLAQTLSELLRRRDEGSVPPFEQIVIETSGLADPAPILHALMTDANLAARTSLDAVIATVDAVNGLATLSRQQESIKQVAVADRLILTKTDLCDGAPEALLGRLAALNPAASIAKVVHGQADTASLFGSRGQVEARMPSNLEHSHTASRHETHDTDICCFSIVRSEPIKAVTLTLLLEALAEHCGSDILRLKGIVNIAESPERPAVVHGVQHVFHPPAWLDHWPSANRSSRFVFIARNLSSDWIEALLAAIEAEVAEIRPEN